MSGSVSDVPTRSTRVAMTVLVAGGIWLLLRLGDLLGTPAGLAVDLQRWMDQTDPALLAAALLRLLGLLAGVYLGGVLAVATLADLVRWRALARLLVRVTPAVLRSWLVGSVTIGLASGVMVTSMPAAATPLQRTAAGPDDMAESTAVMVKLDDVGRDDATVGDDDGDDHHNPDGNEAEPPAVVAAPPASPAAAASPQEDVWVVSPGESFWSIAEEVLEDRGTSTRELTAFWARFIDANRDRLADPHNPDLLFPGQELIVPET
jgi:hypothetical protein